MTQEQEDFAKQLAKQNCAKPVKQQPSEPTKQELLDRGGCCKTGCKNCPWGFART